MGQTQTQRHLDALHNKGNNKAECNICRSNLSYKAGSTNNLRRHLNSHHPWVQVAEDVRQRRSHNDSDDQDNAASVEVTLEDSDTHTTVMDADNSSAINGILDAAQGCLAQQMTHEEESDDRSVKCRQKKRSLVWKHYEYLDSLAAARCRICMKKLQCSKGSSTSNLHRHLSNRHPGVFSQLVAVKQHPSPPHSSQGSSANSDTSTPPETVGAPKKQRQFSVEVTLEDSDIHTTVNDADINSAINGILEAAQGSLAEQITHEEESDDRSVKRKRNKRSLVWRHYEYLDSLAAARCRICMKKLQCSEGSSTGNLHRHLSNRHPGVFSQLVADKQHPSPPHSSQSSNANGDTSTPPETVGAPKKQRQFSGKLKVSRASGGKTSVLRRERELIEALRRVQKEEARAVEHQRELLENLRAVNAREAAAERQQIESLRKAQLEEAKDLSRQREEVQKEKTQLQKKWEELQQEREELVLLLSREQQAS
ncbi:uncharacterized protein LOC116691134 isoform X5 [Etheostoma spectabile]|uniref:uncharacterized protein LOC116691134 isoform X5 n=1 Tax=Etheostoma spectabile TaxID=54343 RepID=UPI0013AF3335|nr:uncharacterized protein LOC116691134 isoform X5 [Etheostoma spectabile]